MLAPPSIPATVTFIPHRRSPHSPVLAHMLDSLVRVSRRGKENHFVPLGQFSKKPHNIPLLLHLPPNEPKRTSLTTAPNPQAGQEVWRSLSLLSFASFSAISGTL